MSYMDDSRTTKLVFLRDYELCVNNWCADVKKITMDLNLLTYFENKSVIDLEIVKERINALYAYKWLHDVNKTPKLRTYKLFKSSFVREEYLNINLTKNERSMLCQFRSGILPLRI